MNVDTTSTITHVSLCAGYGGIDLGLKRAIPALRTIAFSEIEAFACANLVAKMEAGLLDPAPIWTDLKTFPWAEFRDRVGILSGGYPCQPFSAAGKRLGAEDPRHLWPYISAGIAAMRPSVCFFENVEGHISLGLPDVIEDLAGLGYRATWGIFSASEVGAPHQRKRVFILAYDSGKGLQGNLAELLDAQGWQESSGSVGGCSGSGGAFDLADPNGAGSWEDRKSSESWSTCVEQSSGDSRRSQPREIREGQTWPSRPSEPQHWWEPPRVVANDHSPHAGHGEQRPERTLGDLSGGCGEAMGNASSERCQQTERVVRSEQQAGRVGEERGLGAAEASGADASGEEWLADTQGSQRRITSTTDNSRRWIAEAGGSNGESNERQTQPSLGRDADGPADWLDDAELFVTCDNRTDELRLLGNGVVPATAERAFRVLVGELMEHNS